MAEHAPKVSIGLPVYNGQHYLSEAIECLLGQTFTDIELIVSDNASTDSTPAIVRRFAEKDSRVRYVRAETNRGLAWNFNRVVALARGEYFKWAASDDLCAPNFLARLVDCLDRHPEAAWCHSWTGFIDSSGARVAGPTGPVFRYTEGQPGDLFRAGRDAHQPGHRFRAVVLGPGVCYDIYGLFRLDALRRSRLHRPYFGADKVHMAEMALLGRFVEVPEVLFFCREHPGQATCNSRRRQEWITRGRDPGPIPFPRRLRCLLGYLGLVASTPVSWPARLSGLATLAQCCLMPGKWKCLARETFSPIARLWPSRSAPRAKRLKPEKSTP